MGEPIQRRTRGGYDRTQDAYVPTAPPPKDTIPDGRPPGIRDVYPPPEPEDWRAMWPRFVRAIGARLELGEREYGDTTQRRPAQEIIAMAEEELLDLPAYAFLGWCRLQRVRAMLRELEERHG